MFFKKTKQDKPEAQPLPAAPPARPEAPSPPPVAAAELRRETDPATLGFTTTAGLTPAAGLVGQDRAERAIRFGADMKAPDFNLFVLGPPSSGKRTAVRKHLEQRAASEPAPSDWAYVFNFDDHNRPRALRLPHGRVRALAKAMTEAVDELRTTLPALFEGEEYQARRRSIDEEARSTQEEALEELNRRAAAQNIALLRTPMGFAMAPMHEGKVVKPEVFNALPEQMRKEVEAKVEALQTRLEEIVAQAPKVDKVRRAKLRELNEQVARVAVRAAIDDVELAYADVPAVITHLAAVEADLVRNAALFLSTGEEEENAVVKVPADSARDARFRRYMVNVVVANGERGQSGAPIVEELNPTFGTLLGRVEHLAQMGTLVTDFLLVKPGTLHRANGGYLLLDARKVLMSPFAWEALKRTLKSREIKIEQPAETLGLVATQTLDPEPIPLDVKVVLLGDRELYYLLAEFDPDFPTLFKVQADFDEAVERNAASVASFAGLVASVVAQHALRPLDAGGVARVIDEAVRWAEDGGKISVEIGRVADLIREADYWSRAAERDTTTRADVERAVAERNERAGRVRDRAQETIARGVVLVDTDGFKVGQLNGLSVLQLGDFAFGRPSRITARVRIGQGRVTDIEREVKLGGPLHSKGVMILWGYLAGRYALEGPLALAATVVFEQSYGGVDGDSASSAELYALLSALADVPLRQGFAVTGSVNQKGEVQAIGGVNEKIEGFFDVCKAQGLTGRQGVLIPRANVQHLMLRQDVVDACAAGKFAVHAVASVDEGIELLTGIKAGVRGADGRFEPGTIGWLVEERLAAFARHARKDLDDRGGALVS